MVRTERLLSAAFAALVVTTPVYAQQNAATAALTPPAGAATSAVTLADAVRLSRMSSPSVVQAQGNIRAAQLSTRSEQVLLFPQLTVTPQVSLNLSNGQSRLDPITQEIISGNQTSPTYTFGASASWTIFDGFQRNNLLKSRRAFESSANATLITTQFAADLTVTTAFFSALGQRQQVAVAQSNVDATQAQLTLASARLQAGSGVVSDSLAALGNYLQARLVLLQAQSNLIVDETNLGRLVGTPGQVRAIDDSAFYRTQTAIDTGGIRAEMMANAPTIVALKASLSSAQEAWKASKGGYYPTLTAAAAQSWTGNWTTPSPDPGETGLQSRRNLSLNLSISPWTNLQRETNIENNAIQITDAQVALADAQNSIAAQINQAFAALSTARETITVSDAAVTAGNEAQRVVTTRYRLGVATITDVLTAQNQLVTAQGSQLTARYSYLLAKAQIEAIAGRKL